MTDFQINDHLLTKECEGLAKDIWEEIYGQMDHEEREDADAVLDACQDFVHEWVDGHEWVIYSYKAAKLCVECNTNDGEAFLEDTGMPDDVTFWSLASVIAYGEMLARVQEALRDIADEMEDAA